MASLQRHSSGRSPYYYCKYRGKDGRIIVTSTKETGLQKAWEVCSNLERIAQQGAKSALTEAHVRKAMARLYEISNGEKLEVYTVAEWMDSWLTGKAAKCAPGTLLRYNGTVERFLKHLGRKASGNLGNVSMTDVRKFRDSEIKDGVSPASADLTVKTLRIPFNLARRLGKIDANPAEEVELLLEGGETREPFTVDQIKRIIASSEGDWTGCIRMGYYTGARLGNCARLRWSEVNWDKNAIQYLQEKRKRGTVAKPVVCPMHPNLQKDLKQRYAKREASEFVFPSLAGRSVSGKTGLSLQFQQIMVKAKIEVPLGKEKSGRGRQFHALGFHSLKHSFNSHLANGNVSQELRKILVGHKSDEINDIYTHLDLDALAAAVKSLPTV